MDGGLFGPRASDPTQAPFLFMLTQRMRTEEDQRAFSKSMSDNGINHEGFGKYVFDLFYTAIGMFSSIICLLFAFYHSFIYTLNCFLSLFVDLFFFFFILFFLTSFFS